MEHKTLTDYDKPTDRAGAIILSVFLFVAGNIIQLLLVAFAPGNTFTLTILLIADTLALTGLLYILYFLTMYLYRKLRRQPKPYATPGFKSMLLVLVISAVLLPTAIFTALALTSNDQNTVQELSIAPTPTAAAIPTPSLRPQEDLSEYRRILHEDIPIFDAYTRCYSNIGEQQGLLQRIDAREDLRVQPRGEGHQIDIGSDASEESTRIITLYRALIPVLQRYPEALDTLLEALQSQGYPLNMENISVEDQAYIVLNSEPFTDAQWTAIRDAAYQERTLARTSQAQYTQLMEILMPGCSGN